MGGGHEGVVGFGAGFGGLVHWLLLGLINGFHLYVYNFLIL